MTDIITRLADLSPEKQKLLALKLKLKADAGAAVAGQGGERASEFPASFAQRRMWLLDRLQPGSTAYSMPRVWRIPGPLDAAALERAVDELVRRHETLRTHLAERGEELVQVVAPPAPFRLEVTDLSALAPGEARAELERLAHADASAPFRLEEGPLFRASLVRLAADDHALLWNLHHAITDGWSTGILSRELKALYQAFSRGEPSPLVPLPLQYGDHALRERERLSGDALARLVGFWRDALDGAPTRLEIAPDRPRPPVRAHRGGSVSASLGAGLPARVDALARAHAATPFMVYLAAFQLLLGRYARQDEVLVGTAIANRPSADVEGIVGFFVNTLVLRGDLSGDPTFAELLARVREATLGAFEHQALPFEKLVEELNPERSLSHAPLVQAVIVLHNQHGVAGGAASTAAAPAQAAGPGLRLEAAGGAEEEARFDLTLELAQGPDGVRARLTYATDLFERGTAERMLGHLGRVVEQVVADADVRLSRLELLSAEERGLVVDAWNRTDAEHPAGACIHELFEAQAARTPEAVAVEFEGETLGYGALNERANRLAHHLAGLGVGPETRVGICLERGTEMIVSVLAVLKAGGGYVPLDPSYPAERLAFMLADAAVPVLVTQESLRAELPTGDGVSVVSVDGDEARIAAQSAENPQRGVSPDHLAYVIYTSGSTGRPKGVMVPHRGVPNLAYAQARRFGIDGSSRILQFASLSFDAAVAELFDALLSGAALVLAPREALLPGPGLLETLRRGRVTVATLPPSMLAVLSPEDLPELRTVVSAGEAVDAATVERWSAGRAFVNAYGPTEVTVCATSAACEADGRVPAIGRPLENVRVYVLDASSRPAPVGVPGELYVGGVGVVRGYLGRPGLTAERFVPDSFSGDPGARLYRTGDRVRWSARGELEFLGRTDEQVKVRGFRIEPGEIEGALRRIEGVADCVVVAREDVPGETRLVAYMVGGVEAGALREHLLQAFPEYMVPSAFVPLEALPLTANGKVDRKALPAPEGDAYARRSYEPPLGEIEAALAEVWAEVLGVERVGRWDHFFELGGHSLLAIKLIERMRRAGLYTDVPALFTTPVLAELALSVSGASAEMEIPANAVPEGCGSITPEMLPLVELSQPEIDGIVTGVPGGAANVQDIYPLAPLQEGFLFHHLFSQDGDPYLTPSVAEFDTRARLDQYLAALQSVIDRHDILRTSVAWEGLREPVQVVWRHAPLPVEEVELDADAGDVEAGAGAAEQLWRRYDPRRYRMDLTRAPLLRASIAEDRVRGRWVLLMLMHHLTGDHESLEVQQEEIAAHLLGRQSELPAPLPFRNYVAQARLGVSREEHERFFRGMLGDVAEPTAPYGLLDVWGEGRGIGEARLRVASDVSARLRRRARALGVTAASLCHLAWAQVLARLSGRQDVVFGTLLFGRMQGGEGTDRVMGPFINTLPVRIGVGEEGAEAAVRRTHVLLADLLRHEHASLALAQRCSGVEAPAPLFTSLLNYRYSGARGRSQEEVQPREGVRGIRAQERTNYPVMLSVDDLGDDFSLTAQVAAPADAGRVCRMMHTALAGLVEALEISSGRAIGSIDVLPEADRLQVLEEWNRTEAEYPAESCIHQLFEAQAARTPDAEAVVFEGARLTYAELNARANRLAHHLRARGVGPEVRVGVLMERSAEMVVALLAVMKAGGAYVPLDPSYPADRLRYVLQDSAPAAVLTQRSLEGMEALFAGVDVPVIDLEDAAWADQPATDPVIEGLTPAHLAYVIYTSGSTGRPKGVAVPHRGVVNHLRSMRETLGMEPADRMLAVTTYAFDPSVLEIFLPLLEGAGIIVLPRAYAVDPAALAEAIRAYAPTIMQATPATWRMLVGSDWEGAPGIRALCGGEALPAELASAVRSRVGALWNVYGPTETTIWATAQEVRADSAAGGQVPIGRPLANGRVYVLDAAGEPVPVGVAGELYIGGAGVVRGYLGRPALTAERFVPDPFRGQTGARMYRTGDLVRWRPDGAMEFVGRTDFQVKVRGFRIELGEIEAQLAEHEDVRHAVVLAREDVPGDQRLVAYFVGTVEAEALRAHLSAALPEYMVPAAYVRLDAFPLSPNGKVDRKALPAPEGDAYATRGYEAPVGETERALAAIWAEVLGVERVGRWDGFFQLGGHSLLAVRVVSRVRQVLGVELALAGLFRSPVLADLARTIENAARTELPPIEPVDRGGRLPLSFAQQRLWFLEQLGDLGSTYHIPMRLRLQGELDRGALRRALDAIVARHEALRTTIVEVEGGPVQRIAAVEESRFHLAEHDLVGDPEAQSELRRLLGEEARTTFDLARGPLIRGRLIRLAPDEHVLLVTMHHVVSDGWSLGVFTRELSALYGAFRRGEPDPLPALPVQYADYAAWQRRWVDGDVLQAQVEYWTKTLGGAPALLELPTDHPRPAQVDHAGALVGVELDEALTAGLKALGQRHGTTLFMTVLAGWAAVLGRLSGQEDVVVGTPSANRGRTEIEGLIGFFVNTLALRVDLAGSPSVAEVLARVKERALGAQQNQDIPFEQVVELVQPERSLSHSPLFQVMFGWQNASDGGLELPGLRLGGLGAAGSAGSAGAGSASEPAAKFDLSLDMVERDGRIVGSVTYATSLFDRATVERHVGYLRRMLEAMAADERQPVDRLALIPADERSRVLEEWNATAAAYPAESCIHQLFEAQAERTPDAVAVVFEDQQSSYAELNARANRLAHHLRSMGVGPDARVAVCMERSAEIVVALLAVMKAGGAYVPLDPSYPAERLRYVLQDSAPAAVLTQRSLDGSEALFAGVDVPVIDLDDAAWADQPATAPVIEGLTPAHLAYVIYTSGSTGRPKGVAVPHRGVVNLLHSMRETVGMEPADRLLAVTTYAFDISVLEIFLPLLHGAASIVLPRERAGDPAALAEAIRAYAPTVMQATPATWRLLVSTSWEGAPGMRALCGGEALPAELASAVRSRVAAFWNVYGPTETTIWSTSEAVRGDRAGTLGVQVPIGRPLANTRVYVLDAAGEPVPVGVAGELYIGGVGVVRGYLGRPALTAERFVADPFAGEAGARMYRTGDLARWRPDGTMEFVGRTDFQVKVRGFRIELGEIEARLAEHADVRQAVVLAREDVPGDQRLVAYFVGAVEAETLRAYLSAALPEYMVPAAYVRLETLPLTPNGKLDRKALPAPEGDAYATRGYEAPVGETERALAAIWAEVLGMERVGRWDGFFQLGGHSLLAVRVMSRVRQVLGVEVALAGLFRTPVLADLARTIESAARTELPPIERVDRGGRLPLSFAQQRLWFLEQLGDLGSTYHIPMRLRLQGELDRGALVRALDAIVARHEALRTTLVEVEGGAVQRIAPVEASRFHRAEHDLDGDPEAQSELRRLLGEEARMPFDLARGPLIRGRLIRLAPDEHVLVVTMHHVVSDGWSLGVFTGELGALYGAFRRGEPDPLPPLPVQYADYAAWQRRWVDGDVLQAQVDYWRATLGGAPALLELPTDHPRPAEVDHAGASVGVELDEALTAGLKALGQRHGTTLFMTVLAGWAVVLGRLSRQEDVVIGTPSANRGRTEIEGLIGFFVNTLALRVDLAGSPSVADVLARVKDRALGAQQNQDIPFEQVVELVQPVRSLSHSPLFQVMFGWQNASDDRLELPGLRLGGVGATRSAGSAGSGAGPASEPAAKFDLSLDLVERDGRIVGGLTYATTLFDRATVERHVGYLRRVLEAMAADERQPLDRLALLPEHERRQVVEAWNRTEAEYPADRCIHELFEAQVERTPDAEAVVFEDRSLTYAALNERANRLAHHLRGRGVGPEVRVGVLMERSAEMVVALLAIMKAGGAYVPLDPSYPAERLRYLLQDSAPAAVLTQCSLDVVEALFAGVDVPVIDFEGAEWADQPATAPAIGGLAPANLAYVIYTSGSTGRPKGVAVPHRGVVNHLRSMRETVGMEPADRVLAVTTYAFDPSVLDLFLPLLHGAATIVLSRERAADPEALAEAIRAYAPTMLQATPATWRMLVGSAWAGAPGMRALCGGEALTAELASAVRSRVGALWNVYGPTETTIWATAKAVRADSAVGGQVPIGRPLANGRVYVLDAAGEPVPVGVAGELYIGGVGVVRGYWGRPALTAERFVADPFAREPGARMYRTGDLVRWRPDGTMEFVGRTDFQVKVRGFRIELGEIEARLAEHADVRQAVVLAREDVPGDQRLVAYFVGTVEAEALRVHLSAALPEYMVPAAYVRLETLPLTPNGKVDRKALPAPEGDAYATRGYEAPVGETELALAAIWAEVLGVERVGRWDGFFQLGGHSLLAVRVMSRVRQVLGVEVPLTGLFRTPVLADLARTIESAARTELPPIERVDRGGRLPLSFAQQRLWFLEQLGDLGSTYHIPTRLRLQGELDREALRRALDAIVARHEALRTTLVEAEGGAVQRIAPVEASRFHLAEHDLDGDPEAQSELRRLLGEEARTPFDLARGPLIRGRLIRLAPDEHVLVVTMHHVVSDGWSIGVFTGELGALYGAFRRGEPDPLPPLPVQYADYAAWQRRWVDGDVLQAQVDYWRATLGGAPALLELPTDHPRPAHVDHAGASLGVELDEALTAGLKTLSQRHGTTLFMTVLAGWAAVLGRLSGQDDVVIGTPSANRGRTEIEGLIGFFVNTLALRVDLAGSPSVADVLARVKDRALGAQQNQDIPFEQVVELVQPVRSLSHSPLFQVMFGWQNASEGRLELPGLRLGGVVGTGSAGSAASAGSASEAAAKFDLSLDLVERDGRIVGGLTYATSLFDRATVERHVGYLRRVLEAMVADERQPVDRLALIPADERSRVLEAWNATEAAYPAESCIHQLFQAQAARTPDAVAVVFEGRRASYAELNARANRLAHHLRSLGVGPDARVAVCVERSAEMVVALLAVMKAGGAYVPLDPSHPAERLEYVLADSAPAAVLTQKQFRDRVGNTGVPVLHLDADGPAWADHPATDLAIDGLTPAHLAYVMYTSGSTGRPKGVAVPHRGVVNLLRSMHETVGMEPADRLLAVTTYAFDISVLEIFLPLLHGAATIILPRERAGDPAALAESIRTYAPTVMQATPATWRMLVSAEWAGAPEMRALCGGEALPAELASAVRSRVGGLWNVYGPTETTIWSTAEAVRGDSAATVGGQVPIGRPLANTRVYVLDAAGEPVPVGVAGELYIGGAGVVRGYLGRPALTAERFVADPFASEAGARMYRTGDLARWRPDGTMEFVGRTDFQVKVRGFRIELGEIEARLAEHADVRHAVVLVREDVPGDQRLVAYVVGAVEAEALRAHLSAVLPEYMVPAAYVRLDALPLTPNGKLDRKALPAPEGDAYASREYEEPVGKFEVALAEIWAELLRVERVGRKDHFFELGGHSLLALQVVSRVRQGLGVELALGVVFEMPVLSALAERILELRLAQFDPETIARLAQLVREPGAETVPAREEPG